MKLSLPLVPLVAALSLVALPLAGCSDSTTAPGVPPASAKTTSSGEAQVDRSGAPVVPHTPKPTSSGSGGSTDRMGNPTGR